MTVPLPAAPRGHVVYFLADDGGMLERHVSGNNESVVRALGARPLQNVLVGSLFPDITGSIRLVRNDNLLDGHDSDRDGLGDELEKDIGTCSTLREIAGDWECSRSTDPRDTDGDGLADDLELLGLFTPSGPFQLLPRWGADHPAARPAVRPRRSRWRSSTMTTAPSSATASTSSSSRASTRT